MSTPLSPSATSPIKSFLSTPPHGSPKNKPSPSLGKRGPAVPAEPFSGSIELILGPMFSGKSTELIRRIRRLTVASKKCLVVKYFRDVRYTKDFKISTHDMFAY